MRRVPLSAVAVLLSSLAIGVPTAAADPVIMAAGDIACASSGSASPGACSQAYTSNLLLAQQSSSEGLDAVLTLGDNQYESGGLGNFRSYFDPTWGRLRSSLHPTPGNHEYATSGAAGYFDYFGGIGVQVGNRGEGWYSFDVGSWHLIALNSSDACSPVKCTAGSPQETWLRNDLAATQKSCVLAYWHHPLRYAAAEKAMWQDLYDAGADVVLAGHNHTYQKPVARNPSGAADPNGPREVVVGTGGKSGGIYGVLKLTLHADSYDWKFVGSGASDSGSAACHGSSPPPGGGGGGGGEPPPASGVTLVGDTKANAGSPATSYGADTTVRVKSASYRSFLKFTVNGLSGAVTGAKLQLKAVTQKSPDGGDVYLVGNALKDGVTPWTESNLTWSTMPDLGTRKIGSVGAVDPAVGGGVVSVPLDASAFAGGDGTYSLALDSKSTTSAYFSSKEGGSGPQLLLTTGGSPPPPTASPPVASFTTSPSSPTVNQSVTFTSTSTDPDNDIAQYDWLIDGVPASGPTASASFSTAGPHSVTLTVTDGGGRTDSKTQTVTVSDTTPPPGGTTVTVLADAQVKSTSASTNYGGLATVRVREGTSATDATYRTYLKLRVSGLTGTVTNVKLKLKVDGASGSDSKDSGDVYLVNDTTWGESTLTWANRPAITTAAIGTAVAAPLGGTILIDLHTAITVDGTYTLALASHGTDSAIYASKEGGTPATLVFS
jgi:PKD repeat protein